MLDKLDKGKLRNVAGAFATGITAITVKKEDGSIYGMTANSFLSVSLDPPLVMFSVQNSGTLMEYCKPGQIIGISVLSEDQEVVSSQFAGFNKKDVKINMIEQSGASVVANAMAWYSTIIDQVILVGDHHLVICGVQACDRDMEKTPLLYFGSYRTLNPSSN